MKVVVLAAALIAGTAFVQAAEMKDMGHQAMSHDAKPQGVHKATGVVKKLDPKTSTVSLAHEPVKSLSWPAMTMTFKVHDKATLDKLAEGRKVQVEFEQRGKDYVITKVN